MSTKKTTDDALFNAVRSVMSTAQGREFVWHLLSVAHVFESTFATNALTMSFLSGQRDLGLRILALVTEVDQDLYLTMQREAMQREEKPQ